MLAKRASKIALVLLGLGLSTGCHSIDSRRQVALSDAPLTADGSPIVNAAPVRTATFVDRHPLLWKPREYYDTTAAGSVGKTAAATFVGVPAGIVGEIKQIVVGIPPAERPY